MEGTWNGLIVPDGALTPDEEFRLAERGICRVMPDWKEIFDKVRVRYPVVSGEPFDAPQLMVHVCDCAFFVANLYGETGLKLPKDVVDFWRCGMAIDKESLEAGDLVFVHDPRLRLERLLWATNIHHVGVVSETGSIMHVGDGKKRWEGMLEDFLFRGRFLVGCRMIGRDGIATYALGKRMTERLGFSFDNLGALRSYL